VFGVPSAAAGGNLSLTVATPAQIAEHRLGLGLGLGSRLGVGLKGLGLGRRKPFFNCRHTSTNR
jgi:hypothetical protein